MGAIEVTEGELSVLLEALDALEHWQLGDGLPRHDGMVWIPGDAIGGDRFWPLTPRPEEREKIEAVQNCRRLASRLSEAARSVPSPPASQ